MYTMDSTLLMHHSFYFFARVLRCLYVHYCIRLQPKSARLNSMSSIYMADAICFGSIVSMRKHVLYTFAVLVVALVLALVRAYTHYLPDSFACRLNDIMLQADTSNSLVLLASSRSSFLLNSGDPHKFYHEYIKP